MPSTTETLLLGKAPVVGRTSFCAEPSEIVRSIVPIGGTKNPDLAKIVELDPDLVIANRSENRREDVEALRARNIPVWVHHPVKLEEVLDYLGHLGQLGVPEPLQPWIERCREAVNGIERGGDSVRPRVLILIWKDPWMGVGSGTYIDSLVDGAGGINVLADRPSYPVLSEEDVRTLKPDFLLLPTEPYPFGAEDQRFWLSKQERAGFQVEIVNGQDLAWFGHRMAVGLAMLRRHLIRN